MKSGNKTESIRSGGKTANTASKTVGPQGHRRRLSERFRATDGDGFNDYELLELLLCHAIPRRDVKPAAKTLLARFGSLRGVLGASEAEQRTVPGIGPAAATLLRLVHRVFSSCVGEDLRRIQLRRPKKLTDEYLCWLCGSSREECLTLLLLDKSDRLIDRLDYPGGARAVGCSRRELLLRILSFRNVAAVVAVHNHPDERIDPSESDLEATRMLGSMLTAAGIRLKDSLIVSGRRGVSMMKLPLDRKR